MNGIAIGFDYEKGEIISKSQFDKYNEDAELTELENQAVKIIKSAFEKETLPFDKIKFRRHSQSYLSLFIFDPKINQDTDFCRIKAGVKSIWISLDMWRAKDYQDDMCLSAVTNKNQRHWKVKLNCIDDFENITDLIINVFKSIVL